MVWVWRLVALAGVLAPVASKVEHGTLSLSSANCEAFVTKFAFNFGAKARVEMRFTGHDQKRYLDDKPHSLQLSVFNDEAWEKYQAAQKAGSLCADRMQGATGTFHIHKGLAESQPKSAAKDEFDATRSARAYVGEDGKIEFVVNQEYELAERSHYFFFVLSDCSLEWYDAHPPTLDYWLHLTSGGKEGGGADGSASGGPSGGASSELPAFERGLVWVHGLVACGLAGACAVAAKGLAAQHKRYGQVHLSAAGAALATLLQCAACALEFVHLRAYASDGMGYRWRHGRLPLDFLSDLSQCLSESVTVVLVLSVGCGWTLLDGSARRLLPVWSSAAAVVPTLLFLELVSRKYEDDFSTFHDHDHWPGQVLAVLRALTTVVLWTGNKAALERAGGLGEPGGGGGQSTAATFLRRFKWLGCAWLLAFPAFVFGVAPVVPATGRHLAVTLGTVGLQSAALGAMLTLFLGLGAPGAAFLRASTITGMGDLSDFDQSSPEKGGGVLDSLMPKDLAAALGPSGGSAVSKALRRKVAVD